MQVLNSIQILSSMQVTSSATLYQCLIQDVHYVLHY